MTHPETISKYHVTGVLGEGAMGVVYKALDPRIDRIVAIKTIHPGMMMPGMAEEMAARFLREIRAVGNLRHPNIVAIYDTDEQDGVPFYVMEYVEGRELSELFRENARFAMDQVLHIGRQLLDAFAYTHQRGIIHRDIKPANIFITNEGDVKVADFGIARVENSELTQAGTSLGTPSYMSPEQCAGQAVDNRSDLFSIGIVLYQLLTGEKPFQGSSTHAVIHHILQSTPERPSALNPALSTAVDKLMERALAKNPADRFQSAEEFLRAWEAALQGRTVAAPGKNFWGWWAGSAAAVYAVCLVVFLLVNPRAPASVNPKVDAGISNDDIGVQSVADSTCPTLTSDEQAKVAKFLKLAKISIDSGRLVWPPTSNAVFVYRLAMEIDPCNEPAREGLRNVLRMLIDKGHRLRQGNNISELTKHLEISLQAFPHSHTLLAMQRSLGGGAQSAAVQ